MSAASTAGEIHLGDLTVPRFGYGTMRLTGPGIFGPPADRAEAVAVLRRAVELGIRVIDTAWYYGPFVADEILAEALSPYPDDLVIVTKHGGARRDDGSWYAALRPEQLREGVVHDLRLLGIDSIPLTHLRWMDADGVTFDEALEAMLGLVAEGKVRRIGLSNIDGDQLDRAVAKTAVASVSNNYSVVRRDDEAMVTRCARDGIAYIPFFPLGASPRTSGVGITDTTQVAEVAERYDATPAQVALAWLLHHSPAILPIPGTSQVNHLEENLAAVDLRLSAADLALLDQADS